MGEKKSGKEKRKKTASLDGNDWSRTGHWGLINVGESQNTPQVRQLGGRRGGGQGGGRMGEVQEGEEMRKSSRAGSRIGRSKLWDWDMWFHSISAEWVPNVCWLSTGVKARLTEGQLA